MLIQFPYLWGDLAMMGPRQETQAALFYEFSLDDHVPHDHLLRSIDRFVDLDDIRQYLADFYSHTGRPSIDPELLIRMLLVGYCLGIRSEHRLCEEVHLIAGFVVSIFLIPCPIIRHFPKIGTGAFGRASCCVICSRRPSRVASRRG